MWPFTKRTSLADSGIFRGFTDWHCHLLPGVDDGVQTMEETLRILSLYEELGVTEVWLTPHIMEDMPNTTASLKARFKALEAAYQGNIGLHLASENMLDNLFEERLEQNDLLPLGKGGKHLLVETSYFNPPMGLNNILLRIKSKGYVPVLAHPERYVYMDENNYRALKDMNVLFQLNLFHWSAHTAPESGKGRLADEERLLRFGRQRHAQPCRFRSGHLQTKLPQTGHGQVFKADLW